MEVIKLRDIGTTIWNQYIKQLEGSSFFYLAENIAFQIEYAKHIIANESFVGVVDKKPVLAACVYIYESEQGDRSISWGGRYCSAPIIDQRLDYDKQEKYIKFAMNYIDEISEKYHCSKTYFKFEPIANAFHQCKILNYNYLIKYGFHDTSSLTQVLDLREDLENIYRDIRKGHKSDIKKGKEYQIVFYDQTNVTEQMLDLYREIYEYDAGMVTRNSELSYHYYKFIKAGYGAIGFAKNENGIVAVIIATYCNGMAYYSSYAEKTDCLNGKPVGHVLQWELIQYLKRKGIQFYELGEQIFGEYEKGTEEAKLVNISRFKRGFGGYTVPMFRGVKG